MARNLEAQRKASRKHYAANKEAMVARAKEYTVKNRERLRVAIAVAKSVPCVDCGGSWPPRVMDLHHLGKKESNIADMVTRSVSLKRLEAEIAKCVVLCANCHRLRH